jgi:hypothetical protein
MVETEAAFPVRKPPKMNIRSGYYFCILYRLVINQLPIIIKPNNDSQDASTAGLHTKSTSPPTETTFTFLTDKELPSIVDKKRIRKVLMNLIK